MYQDRTFSDRRHLVLAGNALRYLLDKHRDQLLKTHNDIRRKLKEEACEYCLTYKGCTHCTGEIK